MLNRTRAVAVLTLVALALPGCGRRRVAAPTADASAAAKIRAGLGSATAPAAAGDAAAPTGTGWATLKGRFTFGGSPSAPKALVVDKDVEVCTAGGRKLLDRSLLVDPATKGIANVVVFARKTSRVKGPVPAAAVVFDQKSCEFLTPVVAARVGQTLEVKNSDTVGHNTNLAGTSFNQLIAAGGSTPYKIDAETGMPTMITCNVHPWMKAYGVFRKDGYVALSAADGAFAIADLPAGEPIEFQVWHERAGSGGAVGLAKPDLKWTPKGRFTITLQPDEVRDLGTLEVPAAALGG
ncbi:MAG: hypothetical protein ACKOZU_06200 [Planctomycetaceae bacterium]